MGKINRGILGGFRGRVANVVGSSWKGTDTMRSLPINVAYPATTKQVDHTTIFKKVALFGTSILSTIVKPLNDRFAVNMSGYAFFCKRNKDIFNKLGEFIPANVVLSSGKLGDTELLSFVKSRGQGFDISWFNGLSNAYQSESDKAGIVICNSDGVVIGVSAFGFVRNSGVVPVLVDQEITPGQYHCFLAFINEAGNLVGNTSFRSVVVA